MRLGAGLGIAAVESWFPDTAQTVTQALDEGLIDRRAAGDMGYESLPVSEELAAPEMAVIAARAALRRSGIDPAQVGLVLHAWMYHQGHDLWSPAHYIADQLRMPDAVPVGVRQVCNGGAMAIELAAARLLADPTLRYALITTADRFAQPGFNRWTSDYGIAYGDGATAVLLHRDPTADDDLVLRAISTAAAPALERMHRGDDAFGEYPMSHSPAIDMRRTKKAYLVKNGFDTFTKIGRERVQQVIGAALADSGTQPTVVLLPRLGRKMLTDAYRDPVAEIVPAEILDLGTRTGHLGPGDTAASLAELRGRLVSGEDGLVLNAGAGFTWSALAVRVP